MLSVFNHLIFHLPLTYLAHLTPLSHNPVAMLLLHGGPGSHSTVVLLVSQSPAHLAQVGYLNGIPTWLQGGNSMVLFLGTMCSKLAQILTKIECIIIGLHAYSDNGGQGYGLGRPYFEMFCHLAQLPSQFCPTPICLGRTWQPME